MDFDTFFYSLDTIKNIDEMNFSISNDLKYQDCWLGYNPKFDEPYWFGLVPDGTEAYEFKTAYELVNAKIFYGKSLKDIWDSIEIYSIQGCCLEDWFQYFNDWFLKYKYRVGSNSSFSNLGYDIVFYPNSYSIIKVNWIENGSPINYTLNKSKFKMLQYQLQNLDCSSNLNSIGICDGYSSYIEFKQDNQIKKFGGYNPQDENYLKLENLIQNIIGFYLK